MSTSENNKLYSDKHGVCSTSFMLVMAAVCLFMSRVVLKVLGAADYGIYNIIGSVVLLFSFINAAMTSATQRYPNFYTGKKDERMTKCGKSVDLMDYRHFQYYI